MTRTLSIATLFLCSLLAVFSSAHAAEPHIPLYHATYAASRNDLRIGTAQFSLVHNHDGSYNYKSITRPSGLAALFFSDVITETSTFRVRNGQLQSLSYHYTHSGNDHDKPEHVRFDWEQHTAIIGSGKDSKHVTIEAGVMDRALAQLAISLDLAEKKSAGPYRVLDHDKLVSYDLEPGKDTELDTPDGRYRVIELARKDKKKNRTTRFWLAPKLEYLPVQIEQTQPGKATITLTLASIRFDPPDAMKQ